MEVGVPTWSFPVRLEKIAISIESSLMALGPDSPLRALDSGFCTELDKYGVGWSKSEGSASVEMGKENPSFLEILNAEPPSAPLEPEMGEGGVAGGSSPTVVGVESSSPMIVPHPERSEEEKISGKAEIDFSAFMSKLSSVNQNILKLKEASLLGFVIGKPMEMGKLVNKLKLDWTFLQAPFREFCKGNRWFEIRSSNSHDKNRIWEGRPYHLFSQLLLLKQWRASFDYSKESTTKLDMWVRILQLPPQYISPDILKAIIEMNNVGEFVKLDPYTARGTNVSFPRLCICAKKEDMKECWISVPDEEGNPHKFKLWCEELQKRCGFCGDEGHLYPVCPLRIIHKKRGGFGNSKNRWNFSKFSGKEKQDKDENDGWQRVTKKKSWKAVGVGTSAEPSQMNNYPGMQAPFTDSFNPIVDDPLHAKNGNEFMFSTCEKDEMIVKNPDVCAAETDILVENFFVKDQTETGLLTNNVNFAAPILPNDDLLESAVNMNSSSPFMPVQYTSRGQVIYLIDDLEVENDPENLGELTLEQIELLRNANIPNATFVNEEFMDATSNNSFASFTSNNSTVSKLGKLAMEVTPEMSTGSGKKREKEGDSDTASSKLKGPGTKRMRFYE